MNKDQSWEEHKNVIFNHDQGQSSVLLKIPGQGNSTIKVGDYERKIQYSKKRLGHKSCKGFLGSLEFDFC